MDGSKLRKSLTRLSSVQLSRNPQKSILSAYTKHARILKVVHQGIDVTPITINPQTYRGTKEKQVNIYDIHESTNSEFKQQSMNSRIFTESTLKFRDDGHTSRSMLATVLSIQESNFIILQSMSNEDMNQSRAQSVTRSRSASKVSLHLEPLAEIGVMPSCITLTLHETDTFFIFELNSSTVDRDTPEGIAVECDNKQYEFLTVGKGRNRKVMNAEVQTMPLLLKSRETQARKKAFASTRTFASLWDMYDTFLESNTAKSKETGLMRGMSMSSLDSYAMSKDEREWTTLLKNEKFLEAVCIIHRLLSNNIFNEEQKRFRGLKDPSPFRENIEYKYNLNLLWTFANDSTKGHCVSALCWNPSNKDILAVGYGKFLYDEETTGMVYLWNIKNCVQPEREFQFISPVTSVDFSIQNPNLLAIGFHDGTIKVIDVSARIVRLMGTADKQQSQLFEPIWQVHWYTDHDYYKGQEFLAATCQDGRICKFQITKQGILMPFSRLMQVTMAEGKLKGIETIRKCPSKSIQLARHSPALVFAPHPVDPNIYFVGTGEGVVHKCSKNYYHQHLDLFLAHDSPMYAIKFSPFCTKLYLTCGDDWAIRLWADSVAEPLFEIKKRMAGVQDVAWSPSHSTIIASISGMEIFIWDFQRKTYDSQSVTVSPTKSRNTLLKFTDDGRCLLVADIDGNVHVFALEDMPFPAFFQQNLLTESIKRALVTRPDLLNRIEKIGSLSFDASLYEKYK